MAVAQPFTAVCSGGLDLISSPYELLRMPNVATELVNFEVSNEGGYKRLEGFTAFGEGSATNPEGSNPILGVTPYGLGVVVCVDTSVYYTEDGISWLQVNKDTTGSGALEAAMGALGALDRPVQEQAQFILIKAPTGRTSTTYGSLSIATGGDKLARFRIEGTGGSRLFFYEEYTVGAPTAAKYLEEHERHLCVVDATNDPSTVNFSANNDDSDFTGTGSGSVTINDKIVGIKSFRNELYIFGESTVRKLININDPSTQEVQDVTLNLGCVSGYSIQEIGGDLIFLSHDGFRSIAGTDRLSDVELGTLSKNIQPLISNIVANVDRYTFNSIVIHGKDQYRLFYTDETQGPTIQRGIIATLRSNKETGGLEFQWSESKGIEVGAIGKSFASNGVEKIYHGNLTGSIYTHDVGDTFDGTDVSYVYKTPDIDYGDAGMRKTLHYMLLSVKPSGSTDLKLKVSYDFATPNIVQPAQQDVGTILYPTFYGTAVYGTSIYGSSVFPTKRVNLRGSGTSSSFKFSGSDAFPSFTITGFYITFVTMDRR